MLLLSVFLLRVNRNPAYITRREPALGTFVTITVEKTGDCGAILDGAFEKIRELEMIFSIYNPDSELSRLNSIKEMEVSDHMLYLIRKSMQISELTGGAFDITVLPMMQLYKEAGKAGVPPSEIEIKKQLEHVGWKKIKIEDHRVTIPMGLDMGGIAKGYIADRTAEFLRKQGIENALVNAGGNISCFGKAPGKRKWRIGIQNPFRKNAIVQSLNMSNNAVATSGDYERYIMLKDRKYGHIINPLTGRTVQGFPAGVTVIAPDATTADGLSTAFYVLGAEKSMTISESMKNVAVLVVNGDGKIYRSKNFPN